MTRALAALILLVCLALGAAPARAQETGRITGTVRDAGSGRALPFATISIPELRKGVASDSKGEFLLTGVPVGTYTVRCQFLGYTDATRAGVVVAAGRPVKLEFTLQEVVVREEKEILVTGERPLVEVNRGATVRSISSKDISAMPVQTLSDVIEKQVGVSSENEALHVRGGRSDETVFVIDGVVNRNLISGQSTAGSINARSVAEVNVVTGGFDAKYGQALSGVVDVKLKEGGDAYHGGLSVQGGRFATSYFSGQVSGPDWLTAGLAEIGLKLPGTASFLIDVSADFTDTYLPAIGDLAGDPRLRSGYEDSFLGHKFRWGQDWMPSEDNTWRGLYKWTWKPTTSNKFDVSFSKRIGFDQGFTRSSFEDISGFEIGFPWAWSRRLDHFGTVTEDNNTLQAAWTKLLDKTSFFNVQVSRYFSALNQAVDGKNWTEYLQPQDSSLPDSLDTFYFIDTGDDYRWQDNYSEIWSLGGSYTTRRWKGHSLEAGLRNDWQNVQYVTIQYPWDYDPDGLGSAHDLWHVYPAQGNVYAQDLVEYEGFAANLGLRLDYWVPGEQLEAAVADTANQNITETTRQGFYEDTQEVFGRRVKAHVSPRIQVSHPITEKDNFFFNYGQFTQYPPYYYVYSKLTSVSSESFPILGNANLNPEISVQYEVGARHTFREDLAGNVTLFWKDIYDYPTSVTFKRTQGTELVDVLIYQNQDYARSRGFEVEFQKRRRQYWQYRLTYGFSVASGKSSDPNAAKVVQEQGGDAAETRLGEVFMFWNRPHRATASVDFRVDREGPAPELFGWTMPHAWGLNVYAMGQSGRAYTPQTQLGEEAAKPYSKNAPFQVTFDLRFNKEFRISRDQRINFTITGRNIFNAHVPRRIDPLTGRGYEDGAGLFSPEEMAKLPSDAARQYRTTAQLDNPSNYLEPYSWRVGFDYDF
jgi:outer membrane receptor protein involved in Fe transport